MSVEQEELLQAQQSLIEQLKSSHQKKAEHIQKLEAGLTTGLRDSLLSELNARLGFVDPKQVVGVYDIQLVEDDGIITIRFVDKNDQSHVLTADTLAEDIKRYHPNLLRDNSTARSPGELPTSVEDFALMRKQQRAAQNNFPRKRRENHE